MILGGVVDGTSAMRGEPPPPNLRPSPDKLTPRVCELIALLKAPRNS